MYVDLPVKIMLLEPEEDADEKISVYDEISELTGEDPDYYEESIFTVDTKKILYIMPDSDETCILISDGGVELPCNLSREETKKRIGWINNGTL
jgi:hypothetical protein